MNNPEQKCPQCGGEMKFNGVQRFPTLGREFDLFTCTSPLGACRDADSTKTFNRRETPVAVAVAA